MSLPSGRARCAKRRRGSCPDDCPRWAPLREVPAKRPGNPRPSLRRWWHRWTARNCRGHCGNRRCRCHRCRFSAQTAPATAWHCLDGMRRCQRPKRPAPPSGIWLGPVPSLRRVCLEVPASASAATKALSRCLRLRSAAPRVKLRSHAACMALVLWGACLPAMTPGQQGPSPAHRGRAPGHRELAPCGPKLRLAQTVAPQPPS